MISTFKIVLVGDQKVGKSSLHYSFNKGKAPIGFIPMVYENNIVDIPFENQMFKLNLWDTMSYLQYQKLNEFIYNDAHIILILYSVVDQTSLDNALLNWLPQTNQNNLNQIPKIFVGNKIDLRKDDEDNTINFVKAKEIFDSLNYQYFECSTSTQKGVKELLTEVLITIQQSKSNASPYLLPLSD